MALVGNRNWCKAIDQTIPGGIAQAVKDVAIYFETEVPGVPERTFSPEQAAAITCPVLSVIGSHSTRLAERALPRSMVVEGQGVELERYLPPGGIEHWESWTLPACL